MQKIKINEQAIVSHSFCPRKSYQILFKSQKGETKKYSDYLEKRIQCREKEFFSLRKDSLSFSSDKLLGKAQIIKNANIKIRNLEVQRVHLQKRDVKSKLGNYHYEPLIFSSSDVIIPQDRIKASYIGTILSEIQGLSPQKANIILINGKKNPLD